MKMQQLLAAVVLLMAGCADRESRQVFVVVNGEPITAADVKDAVLLQYKALELSKHPVKANDFTQWANQTGMRIFPSMINSLLLEQEIRRQGTEVMEADKAAVLMEMNRAAGLNCASEKELAQAHGSLGKQFIGRFARAARARAYARLNWEIPVTDLQVRQAYVRMTNEWLHAQKIDADARDKAEKAYRRLQNGEKWANVAASCSEDKLIVPGNAKFSSDWCAVGEDARGIKELAGQLKTMKKGDFTRPFESPEGMMIVRFEGKKGALYGLSRILFRMAKPVNLITEEKDMRKRLQDDFAMLRKRSTLKKLHKEAKFEYPLGTNFTYRIWADDDSPKIR